MSTSTVPTVLLGNDVEMPILGGSARFSVYLTGLSGLVVRLAA